MRRRGSKPESELRVLRHHLRRPRRIKNHLRVNGLYARQIADEFLHLLGHLRTDRACRRGQGEGDVNVLFLDVDVVDQPKRDKVEPQLRVDHLFERLIDIVFGKCCSRFLSHIAMVVNARAVVIYAVLMPLLIALIVWPLLEIYVAILVASWIGVLEMLALVALFSLIGIFVLRNQSRAAWTHFNQAMGERRLPNRRVGDGLLGLAAGVLLLVPGLLSGALGLLLLLPPVKVLVRWTIGALVLRRFKLAGSAATWTYTTYNAARGTGARADYDISGSAEEMPGSAENEGGHDQPPRQLPPA